MVKEFLYEKVPEGTYVLHVKGIPEKKQYASGQKFRAWKFRILLNGKQVTISQSMVPWLQKPLVCALGGTIEERKEGGRVVKELVWDPNSVDGKKVKAYIYYEEDKNGQEWLRLKDFVPYECSGEEDEDNAKVMKEDDKIPF